MPLAYYLYRDVFRWKEALSLESMGKDSLQRSNLSILVAQIVQVSPRSSSSSSRCGNVRSQGRADNRYILLTVDAAARSLTSFEVALL